MDCSFAMWTPCALPLYTRFTISVSLPGHPYTLSLPSAVHALHYSLRKIIKIIKISGDRKISLRSPQIVLTNRSQFDFLLIPASQCSPLNVVHLLHTLPAPDHTPWTLHVLVANSMDFTCTLHDHFAQSVDPSRSPWALGQSTDFGGESWKKTRIRIYTGGIREIIYSFVSCCIASYIYSHSYKNLQRNVLCCAVLDKLVSLCTAKKMSSFAVRPLMSYNYNTIRPVYRFIRFVRWVSSFSTRESKKSTKVFCWQNAEPSFELVNFLLECGFCSVTDVCLWNIFFGCLKPIIREPHS